MHLENLSLEDLGGYNGWLQIIDVCGCQRTSQTQQKLETNDVFGL